MKMHKPAKAPKVKNPNVNSNYMKESTGGSPVRTTKKSSRKK